MIISIVSLVISLIGIGCSIYALRSSYRIARELDNLEREFDILVACSVNRMSRRGEVTPPMKSETINPASDISHLRTDYHDYWSKPGCRYY